MTLCVRNVIQLQDVNLGYERTRFIDLFRRWYEALGQLACPQCRLLSSMYTSIYKNCHCHCILLCYATFILYDRNTCMNQLLAYIYRTLI
jgi:hypothetical protein